MKLITDYKESLQKLYDHVGFVEDYFMCPIDICTDYYWSICGDNLIYGETLDVLHSDGDYYCDEIYQQRFYDKWVYEGSELTMVFCDPQVDGVKWFRFLDNSKRVNIED